MKQGKTDQASLIDVSMKMMTGTEDVMFEEYGRLICGSDDQLSSLISEQ